MKRISLFILCSLSSFLLPFVVSAKSVKLVDYIEGIAKNNNADVNSIESIGTTELAYDGTTNNNLRYIGANPKNFVLFNDERPELRDELQVYIDGDISTNVVRFSNSPYDEESTCITQLAQLSWLGNEIEFECRKNNENKYYIYGKGVANYLRTYIYEEDCISSIKSIGFFDQNRNIPSSIKCQADGNKLYVGGWRIIGLFNNVSDQDGKRKKIKIIRNEPIGKYSWVTTEIT